MADESKEEKLLEKEKLKEWAGEFWEKKRAMKMNGSKSLELTDWMDE